MYVQFVENTIDDANDAFQTFVDDVGELFTAEVDEDDNLSTYTDSVGSVESFDDNFSLDDFGGDSVKQKLKNTPQTLDKGSKQV